MFAKSNFSHFINVGSYLVPAGEHYCQFNVWEKLILSYKNDMDILSCAGRLELFV